MPTHYMTATKAQVEWALSILDKLGEGEDVDGDEFFRANALLTVIALAPFQEKNTMHETDFDLLKNAIKVNGERVGIMTGDAISMVVHLADEILALREKLETLRADNARLLLKLAAANDFMATLQAVAYNNGFFHFNECPCCKANLTNGDHLGDCEYNNKYLIYYNATFDHEQPS